MLDGLILFFAGLVGGVINAIAGGGSFITFPALLLVGVPPVSANATNTFASCAGYLSGTIALRKVLAEQKAMLVKLVFYGLFGGVFGAWLLLEIPQHAFQVAIPWLLLLATLLFIVGEKMNIALRHMAKGYRHASVIGNIALSLMLILVCVYGGFFNAGLGIIALSYLSLAGYRDITVMNGMKLVLSSSVSIFAIALFIIDDAIAWQEGTIVLFGTLAGGYIAGRISIYLPQNMVRLAVIAASIIITTYFFIVTYVA